MTTKNAFGGFAGVCVVLAVLGYAWHQLGAERREALEALRARFGGPGVLGEIQSLEQELGFSSAQTNFYPQVTLPEVAISDWQHTVSAHGAREPMLTDESRGLIVEWTPGHGVVVAERNLDLSDHERARSWEEVEWIAFLHPQIFHEAYASDIGRLMDVERSDVRIIWRAGRRLIARGTAESSPPRIVTSRTQTVFHLPGDAETILIRDALYAARNAPEVAPEVEPWNGPCVADRVGDAVDPLPDATCRLGATTTCLLSCERGNGRSCAEAAYALGQGANDGLTLQLYEKACAAGDMNGCTNYGASIQRRHGDAAMDCARRLFELTCDHDDHFGCGMLAAAIIRGPNGDAEAARDLLRASCENLGMFPCDVLGDFGARGALPEVDLEEAQAAFKRACETGYRPACSKQPDADTAVAE